MDAVLFWNLVALQACSNDYDPAFTRSLDQPGTNFVSRTFAIVHGAMYEAADHFCHILKLSHSGQERSGMNSCSKESMGTVAIAQAAYNTLYQLYPKQQTLFNTVYQAYLNKVKQDSVIRRSDLRRAIRVGQRIALKHLDERNNDGSDLPSTYTPVMQPGYHGLDPTNPNQGFAGTMWGNVKPFIINCVSDFLASNILGTSVASRLKFLNSSLYVQSYEEVKAIGSLNSSIRTVDQTEIANFWGYDGGPKIGEFPRLLNQVVRVIVTKMNNTLVQNARLFRMLNYAAADARIVSLRTKYYYNFWRPILAIRTGTVLTPADSTWLPLGSPADGDGDNYTPAHPSYSSAHVIVGSSTFQLLRRFYGKDSIEFNFQSDEYNGRTIDSTTQQVRPARTRQYESFTQAEMEIIDARVYLGIHWRFDGMQAKNQGRQIADYVFKQLN